MRRGVGIHGLNKQQESKEIFKKIGSELAKVEAEKMKEQLTMFRENLVSFAAKYKHEIVKDPEFRTQFNKMCTAIGVDPLASNKGFWGELLGVGDFYYELGIEIIEICIRTRPRNGGLIEMSELRRLLLALRRARAKTILDITEDDIERAIKSLKCLGSGFAIVNAGSRKLIQSVPVELNTDHLAIMALAQDRDYVTKSQIQKELEWPESRIDAVLNLLMKEGMVWIDLQGPEPQYWFPSLMANQSE